jgi:putative membrane protein
MKLGLTGLALFAVLTLLGCSRREDGAMGEPKMGDESGFVTSTASGGMLEVKLGQYAAENAQDDKVRDFARKMIEDHTRANQSLQLAAEAQGLKVPEGMLKQHQDTYEALTQLSGEDFDRAYARAMAEGHEQTVAAMNAEIARAPQTQVGQWASATLPTVQAHLQHAKQLVAEIPLASAQ